jgi:rhamnosyltransferase
MPTGRALTIRDFFFSNVASVMRRPTLSALPFREDVVMSEDAFWAREALQGGWAVAYVADAVVRHSHHYTLGSVFQRNFDTGAGVGEAIAGRRRDLLRYEAGHLARGTARLVRDGDGSWLPYFLAHEATRVSAVAAGRHWRRLPRRLVQRLSQHGYHWLDRASP